MRILTLHPGPHFSVADVFAGWTKALKRLGVQVEGFPFDARLDLYHGAYLRVEETGEYRRAFDMEGATYLANKAVHAACFEFLPDVVIVVSGMFVTTRTLDVLRSRGIKVVALLTEQPYELGRELALAEHCDLVVLNDPAHLEQFRAVTAAYYQPHSYDPDVHHPGPGVPEWACDIAWCGTAFPSRLAFLEQVPWPTDSIRFAGHWQTLGDGPHRFDRWLLVPDDRKHCLDNADTADLYRSAKCSFNLYRADDEDGGHGAGGPGWAMGPREVELAACGTWFARAPRPEGDQVLSMLPTFTTPDELADTLRWALTHDDARQAAANAARAAIADRTFDNAARLLLPHLERLTAV